MPRSPYAAFTAMLLTLSALAQQQKPTEVPKLQEAITVERIIVDARVTKANGEAITGLAAKDFTVRVDGVNATIESLLWVPETAVARELADIDRPEVKVNETMDVPEPQGRLLIFFFQTDFARNAARTSGQMKIMSYADQIVDSLEAEDRVALFSFDSHLKFRLDFTNDKRELHYAIRQTLGTDEPPTPPIVPMPSLAKRLDRDVMKKTATSEMALFHIGNALRPIPGPKTLVLFGWGLGRMAGGSVVLGGDYAVAKRSLESSRVSVFSIDITQADWHSLQVGLGKVAEDTGGFYQSSYLFPQLAVDRLQRTLEGHYELEVRKPPLKKVGVHTIDVQVGRRDAVVLARTTYVDNAE